MTPDPDTHHHPVVHQALDQFEETLDQFKETLAAHQQTLGVHGKSINGINDRTKALEMYISTNTSVTSRLADLSNEQEAVVKKLVDEVEGQSKLIFFLAVTVALNGIALLLLAVLS